MRKQVANARFRADGAQNLTARRMAEDIRLVAIAPVHQGGVEYSVDDAKLHRIRSFLCAGKIYVRSCAALTKGYANFGPPPN
jgi:hypothetical protein